MHFAIAHIVGREQACAEIGAPDAAAGIDAGAQQEARMIGAGGVRRCGATSLKRVEAGVVAPSHHLQPLRHQRAVDAGQRHHVGHRAEGHDVQPLHEVGFRARPRYRRRGRAACG